MKEGEAIEGTDATLASVKRVKVPIKGSTLTREVGVAEIRWKDGATDTLEEGKLPAELAPPPPPRR